MAMLRQMGLSDCEYTDCKGIRRRAAKGDYSNPDAIEKLVRYVTRTRADEAYGDCLKYYCVFGAASYCPVEEVISQFEYVQKIHNVQGRKMFHFVFSFSELENAMLGKNYYLISRIGWNQACWFFGQGYQTVMAVHDDAEKLVHIHFAVSAINYLDGHKLHLGFKETEEPNSLMNQIAVSEYYRYMGAMLNGGCWNG